MKCKHCSSTAIRQLKQKTNLGYHQYYCNICGKQFNERTGTPLNFVEYPTEVVMMVVFHYVRYKLSLNDVVEMMSLRGIHICHQTVHNWVQMYATLLAITLRKRRRSKSCNTRKKSGKKWHIDATYIKVEGRWCYLYRAIDKEGNLVDVMLSDKRDQAAAERFLRQCKQTTGVTPIQITTDKEAALYPAIETVFSDALHRDSKYKNNIIESDHCGVKSRYSVMKGFKNPFAALKFCTIFEEIRAFLCSKKMTRAERGTQNMSKIYELNEIFRTI